MKNLLKEKFYFFQVFKEANMNKLRQKSKVLTAYLEALLLEKYDKSNSNYY